MLSLKGRFCKWRFKFEKNFKYWLMFAYFKTWLSIHRKNDPNVAMRQQFFYLPCPECNLMFSNECGGMKFKKILIVWQYFSWILIGFELKEKIAVKDSNNLAWLCEWCPIHSWSDHCMKFLWQLFSIWSFDHWRNRRGCKERYAKHLLCSFDEQNNLESASLFNFEAVGTSWLNMNVVIVGVIIKECCRYSANTFQMMCCSSGRSQTGPLRNAAHLAVEAGLMAGLHNHVQFGWSFFHHRMWLCKCFTSSFSYATCWKSIPLSRHHIPSSTFWSPFIHSYKNLKQKLHECDCIKKL